MTGKLTLAALTLAVSAAASAQEAQESVYIEFLWSKPPKESLARQETRQFITQGANTQQICVAASRDDTDVGGLSLDVRDASGKLISHEEHPDYRGIKRCFPARLATEATWGMWTVEAKLGDGRSASKKIRVDPRIEDSPLFLDKGAPYVIGRPNYDASIPDDQWEGKLVWAMTVDPQGQVTHVEVEVAEGVGAKIKDRAIQAGYMTLFSPDQDRAAKPLIWRRTLEFAPD